MCDSDEGGDQDRGGVDLTGFLFGNIDEKGQLEDDGLLDGDSKRMLSSLTRLGLGSMLSEVLEAEESIKEEEEKGKTVMPIENLAVEYMFSSQELLYYFLFVITTKKNYNWK